MCCDGDHSAEALPVAVAESLMEYRAALDHFGPTWRESETTPYHPVTRLVPRPRSSQRSAARSLTTSRWSTGSVGHALCWTGRRAIRNDRASDR